ncbi:MAG: tRNA-intron lyase [archaeon]
MGKIKAVLISEKVSSNDSFAHDLFSSRRFGEKSVEKIFYSLFEAYYLVKTRKMEIFNFRNLVLSESEVLKKFSRLDKKFKIKYLVFKDLRDKGYIVKTALKFGAEFRVYEKGNKVGLSHSRWICFPVSESGVMTWHDFSSKNRVAHSTKKNLLIAVVDDENSVSYYEVGWLRV